MFATMSLTDEVREALIAADRIHTLTELAEKAGISLPKLSLFRAGKKSLAVDSLERLADALGLSIVVKGKSKNQTKKP